MTNQVGQMIGNYRLTRLIGKGGFSEVYLGEHTILAGRKVAIKILPRLIDSSQEHEQFLREARALALLKHQHILTILDARVDGDFPYIMMEYAPNGTLSERHPRGRKVPLEMVVSYVKQISGALQYAHDQGLIHRDVKPANMLLNAKNDVLLSDFGIAVVARNTISYITSAGMAGTPHYMAPELIQSKPLRASDQYSLGTVVYEWLSGSVPFTGDTPLNIIFQHVSSNPIPLNIKAPSISTNVSQVVMRAMEKDPNSRFSNIREFALALEQASFNVQIPESINNVGNDISLLSTTFQSNTASSIIQNPPSFLDSILPTVSAPPSANSIQNQATPAFPSMDSTVYPHSVTPTSPKKSLALGKTTAIWRGHTSEVYTVAWANDGKRIASGGADKNMFIWESSDVRKLVTCRINSGAVYTIAWSSDDQYIATGSADKRVYIWNATTGKKIYTYLNHRGEVFTVAWSPQNTHLATGSSDRTVKIWDSVTGSDLYTYNGHSDWVRAVAWSPDGVYLASASNDSTVQIWNATTGSRLYTYNGHATSILKGVLSVVWSPDGTFLASSGENHTVHLWTPFSGRLFFIYKGHSGPVDALSWVGNSQRIASASYDTTVQVWQAPENNDETLRASRFITL